MITLINDVKLKSGKDSVREVWFNYEGKIESILLRGEGCFEIPVGEILDGAEKLMKKRKNKKRKK